jgi:hypothetical protein
MRNVADHPTVKRGLRGTQTVPPRKLPLSTHADDGGLEVLYEVGEPVTLSRKEERRLRMEMMALTAVSIEPDEQEWKNRLIAKSAVKAELIVDKRENRL